MSIFVGFVFMMLHFKIAGIPIPIELIGAFIVVGSLAQFKQHVYFKFAKKTVAFLSAIFFLNYIFSSSMLVLTILTFLQHILLALTTFYIVFGYYNIYVKNNDAEHALWIKKKWNYLYSLIILQFTSALFLIFGLFQNMVVYINVIIIFFFMILLNRVLLISQNKLEQIEPITNPNILNKKFIIWNIGIYAVIVTITCLIFGIWIWQTDTKYLYNTFTFPSELTKELRVHFSDFPNTSGIKGMLLYNEYLHSHKNNNFPNEEQKSLTFKLREGVTEENAIRDFVQLINNVIKASPQDGMGSWLELGDDNFISESNRKMNVKDYLRGHVIISNDTFPCRVILRFSNIGRQIDINGYYFSLGDKEGILLNKLMNQYFENWDQKGFVTYKQTNNVK